MSLPGPTLPPKPDYPDCCAGGCATCVLDDYWQELAGWRKACAQAEAEWAARHPDAPPSNPTTPPVA